LITVPLSWASLRMSKQQHTRLRQVARRFDDARAVEAPVGHLHLLIVA